MLFTSTVFLLYFLPICIGVYYVLSFSEKLQKIWFVLMSITFYAVGEPICIIFLCALVVFNYIIGRILTSAKRKKLCLLFGIIVNMSIFLTVKYLPFFLQAWYQVLDKQQMNYLRIYLPIGSSIFFLKSVSYFVDCYKDNTLSAKNFLDSAFYFSFFPTVIAGPIVTYGEMQKTSRTKKISIERISVGVCRFVVGLAKKAILADSFAAVANRIFDLSTIGATIYNVPATLAWLGAFTFLLQLYYDFSGYCDMATGLGLMFGYKLPQNMRYPFGATSVTEFYKKWNVTLFEWFHIYVSKPLGEKSSGNKDKNIKIMLLVWILIGFLHGANWTYFFWGVFNFTIILIEDFVKLPQRKINKFVLHLYTIIVITLGFVVFRCKDLYQAGIYYGNMFAHNYNGVCSNITWIYIKEYFFLYVIGILFAFPIANKINQKLYDTERKSIQNINLVIYPIVLTLMLVVSFAMLVVNGSLPFVFHQF